MLQWEKDRAAVIKCHNNDAERPFAVMKWLARTCPSMTLPSLSSIAHAIVNGTFKEGGAADKADPRLKKAIAKLCMCRVHTVGAIAMLVRSYRKFKLASLKEHTKEHRENLVTERQTFAGKRAKKANKASETELVTSLGGLKLKLRGFQQGKKVNKKKSMYFLKLQFYKRAQLEAEGKQSYSSIGDQCSSTSKPRKLKLSPPDGSPKTRELP
jgi:hypothetical protein